MRQPVGHGGQFPEWHRHPAHQEQAKPRHRRECEPQGDEAIAQLLGDHLIAVGREIPGHGHRAHQGMVLAEQGWHRGDMEGACKYRSGGTGRNRGRGEGNALRRQCLVVAHGKRRFALGVNRSGCNQSEPGVLSIGGKGRLDRLHLAELHPARELVGQHPDEFILAGRNGLSERRDIAGAAQEHGERNHDENRESDRPQNRGRQGKTQFHEIASGAIPAA